MRLVGNRVLRASAVLFVLLLVCASPALAEPWTVKLRPEIAYDGDTLYIVVPELPTPLRHLSVRVLGVDTPEIHGKCDTERSKAADARAYVRGLFAGVETITIDLVGWDKYGGRVDAHVTTPDGRDLAEVLVAAGLGRPYHGEHRAGWCP